MNVNVGTFVPKPHTPFQWAAQLGEDEALEAINLIQTERINKFPVVLFGSDYWKGMLDWLKNTMLTHGNISQEDLHLFTVVDQPKEVIAVIKKFYAKS